MHTSAQPSPAAADMHAGALPQVVPDIASALQPHSQQLLQFLELGNGGDFFTADALHVSGIQRATLWCGQHCSWHILCVSLHGSCMLRQRMMHRWPLAQVTCACSACHPPAAIIDSTLSRCKPPTGH